MSTSACDSASPSVVKLSDVEGRKIIYAERIGGEMYIEAKGWLTPSAARALIVELKAYCESEHVVG